MNLADHIVSALHALRGNGVRSVLTMLGMVVGVASVICMVAIGNGARQLIDRQIDSLGANLLQVVPVTRAPSGSVDLRAKRVRLTESDARAIASEVPAVRAVAPAVHQNLPLVHGHRNARAAVIGTTPAYLHARDWRIRQGRAFSAREVEAAAKVAVLGSKVARNLYDDTDPVGSQMRIGDAVFTVIGVLADKGLSPFGVDQDDVVIVPLSTSRLRFSGPTQQGHPRTVDYLTVKVRDAEALEPAKDHIRLLVRGRHRMPTDSLEDIIVQDLSAMIQARQQAGRTFVLLLAAVAAVSLIVGGISIMNIMLVSVSERTREIGVRRALGARRSDIVRQFLAEAVILCGVGGIGGVVIGAAASVAIGLLAGWQVVIAPWSIAVALGFSIAVGTLFGVYPAVKASRMYVVNALRAD